MFDCVYFLYLKFDVGEEVGEIGGFERRLRLLFGATGATSGGEVETEVLRG